MITLTAFAVVLGDEGIYTTFHLAFIRFKAIYLFDTGVLKQSFPGEGLP